MIAYPLVSIILPVRNEEKHIRRALQSIVDQDYPVSRLEIIVADGMSSDCTREFVAEYKSIYPRIILLDNPRKIVPAGLNAALKIAKGEIIIRIDGHCKIACDYVQKCIDYLQKNHVDGVGGSITTIGTGRLGQAIAIATSSRFGVGNSFFRTSKDQTLIVDTIPYPAYTRKVIDWIGAYDEEMVCNEDDEYNYRLRERGGILHLVAGISSTYYTRETLGRLWVQYYRYGYWKVRVFQKHPAQIQARHLVPPIFIFAFLLSTALSLWGPLGRLIFLSIWGSYLLANILATLMMIRKTGNSFLYILPFVYVILHLSYGFGFLLGLLRFWNKWGWPGSRNAEILKSYE